MVMATSGGSTTNRDTCLATALYSWSGRAVSDCKTNDYLYKSGSEWTMTPYAKADLNSFLMYLMVTFIVMAIILLIMLDQLFI